MTNTTPAELLEHAAALTNLGDISLTLDPLEHAWRDMHGDAPPDHIYQHAARAVTTTAGRPHDEHWYSVFARLNLHQVAALLHASIPNATPAELEAGDVIEGETT